MKKPIVLAAAACISLFTSIACKTMHKTPAPATELVTVMSVAPTVKAGTPVLMKFTVQNPTPGEMKFCKWHTPFEGFRNSFLTIKNSKGVEVRYLGIMAKRVMPPPADAYIILQAGKSESSEIDLLKGYDLSAVGTYTVVYNSAGMSGLKNVNTVTFSVVE